MGNYGISYGTAAFRIPAKRRKLIVLFLVATICTRATNYIGDGYMDKISYNPGETAQVFINANSVFNSARMFLYDESDNIVDSVVSSFCPQNISPSNIAPWENGFGYSPSFTYTIPQDLPSGMYNWENKIYFIVKSATKNAAITLVYPSNTEAAYNNAGGKSLYTSNSTNGTRAYAVSFQRPLTSTELTYNRMVSDPFMKWITALHVYDFQVISDQDLDDYTEIANTRILVIVGHSEYWSRTARLNFDQFVNSGNDAIVLSGNTMWWQVRYSADKKKLVCYKDANADTTINPLLKTINWTDALLAYPCLNSIGVDYLHGAYPPSTVSSYHGWGGFKILLPNSPLLQGTGLSFNDTLSCITREYDGALFSGFNTNGDPVLDSLSLGFCKMELIGYDWGQNANNNSTPQMGYGTFIAFKKNYSSGNIINTTSSNWCANTPGGYSGGFGGRDSMKVRQICRNMLDLLLAHANIYSSPNGCTLLTAEATVPATSESFVFPNPASENVNIHTAILSGDPLSFELYDGLGQLVLSALLPGKNDNTINITDLRSGTYFYILRSENAVSGKGTLLVQH